MEFLTKNPTPKPAASRNLLVLLACAANVLLLAYFAKQQVKIEAYGRSAAPQQRAAFRVAAVGEAAGKVLVLRKGALEERRIGDGGSLYGGDRIQTSRRSRATIVMEDRTRLKMGTDSLLVMPEADRDRAAGEPGSVLHLTEGTMEIDSETVSGHVVALRTPNALIKLNVRDIVTYRPQSAKEPAGHGMPYLQFLKDHWAARGRAPSGDDAEYAAAAALVEDAAGICETADRDSCSAAQREAWEGVRRYRRKAAEQQGLQMTVSIEPDGRENIRVEGGAVRIETANRTLTLAGGDSLELEEGAIPTRPNLTESALQTLVMDADEQDLFPEIESMKWQ